MNPDPHLTGGTRWVHNPLTATYVPQYPSHIEDTWTADMLAQIPDDVLVEECRRRGLEVRR